ncbi:VIT domain-containing protein [Neotamlana nanhaiensis]|uniref:VIT domain-containing protein n=1 Tax=Neotamlana nanhaiensis TaxID=1382798 RepID=UPI00069932A1|nr:VIT domain-containing protein [Tamlana nanhaiensis]
MKTFLKLTFVFISAIAFSQSIPTINVGEDKLGISSLDIEVEVVGNIATTTYDMLFYNPTNAVLEGELAFPLGENQHVSRLALEVNNKLREAVVVEKEQGRVAFEAVVRRGVDPVLLEKGTGNNYKARIYPIPANGHKRVVLAYEQELILSEGAHYFHLPLEFKKKLDHFAFKMDILNQKLKPELTKGRLSNFKFNTINSNYSAEFESNNYTPETSLLIKIPQNYKSTKLIADEDYFYFYKTLKTEKRKREKPKSITIYWDASLSMKSRDLENELKFLNAYLNYLNEVNVKLITFSNSILLDKTYHIKSGKWEALKSELTHIIYDGGTSYASLFLQNSSDEILMFSDGMKNLSDLIVNTIAPVFVVNSILKANHSELNNISESTKGKYINLKTTTVNEALEKVKYQSFKFLGFQSSNKHLEAYPNKPFSVDNDFSFTAKNFKVNDSVVLKFGYGNDTIQKIQFQITPEVNNNLVKRIWAQKKLKALEEDNTLNKDEIIKHNKSYNLVSDFTSLIVLETVWDYIKYNITPPEELLEEYNSIVNRKQHKNIVTREEQVNRSNSSGGNISGVVSDESGLPLPGVNVIIRGTSIGVATDFDGKYAIDAIPGSTLVFSYIGYQTLETTVQDGYTINISMKEDSAALDEVVVMGYGTQRKSSVTGSVTVIKNESLSSNGFTNVAQAIQGKVAGVQITNTSGMPGQSPNIIIRGSASLSNGGQPLFVVDGMPVNGNIDDFVNINDIESVTVIKDISAAAIYGSRAANGVVVISTKWSNFSPSSNHEESSSNTNTVNKYRGKLKVKTVINNEPYIKALEKATSVNDAYQIYLIQRETYGRLPAFYIDVHDYFKKWNNRDYELKILTNIAEVDYDNYELMRVLGYKLEERNNYGLASFVYAQVLKLRPEDTQSYRDLALVYKEIGLEQQAFKLLQNIVNENVYKSNSNRRKFSGMQTIAKNELNNVLQHFPNIDNSNFKKKFETKTTFDVRIVIDWNHNDTDIDLHVIDPDLEECYFSNNKTKLGGRLSQDMTQGFGPEEYTLKEAKKGAYFIKVNYYGDRYQKLENPTFMKVTMFKNYNKPNETKNIKIIRLTKPRDKQIVAKLEI